MARLPRVQLPDIPQHIIQRGNNRQICFGSNEDFSAYLNWLNNKWGQVHIKQYRPCFNLMSQH